METNKCRIFALLILVYYYQLNVHAQQYQSVEELLNLKLVKEYSSKENSIDLKDMGMMKILEFNGKKSLFIGARNRVYKIDLADLKNDNISAKSSEALDTKFKFGPFPDTSRTYTKLSYFENIVKEAIESDGTITPSLKRLYLELLKYNHSTSFDTCLTYRERTLLRNFSKKIKAENEYNRDYLDLKKFPGNVRPIQAWTRYPNEVEESVCKPTFIRGLEKIKPKDSHVARLWVCGTFSGFPKAFLLDPDSLKPIDPSNYAYHDTNVMSCARWPDEPMVTKVVNSDSLFIGSGWGLYRPASADPDVPYNNSTMLYSDWKALWNGYHWPTRMAMVFGRDVRFISRVEETDDYLYFFGLEVNPQYSYINSLTRQAYQSFMLRICKNDTGYNYTASWDMDEIIKYRRNLTALMYRWVLNYEFPFNKDETKFSYSAESWGDTHHFPTKHFTSAIKFPFGCYLKRYDGAQSKNDFWGDQNIIYFNRLGDVHVSFNFVYEDAFTKYCKQSTNCKKNYWYKNYKSELFNSYKFDPNNHIYNAMYGAFSSVGFTPRRRQNGWEEMASVRPSGAVCQFHLSEWKTDHMLYKRKNVQSFWDAVRNVSYRTDTNKGISKEQLEKIYSERNKVKFSNKSWETLLPKNQRTYIPITAEEYYAILDNQYYDVATWLSQKEEFFALYGTMQNSFFSRGHTWFEGLQPTNFAGIDFTALPNVTDDIKAYLHAAMDCGKCRSKEELRNMSRTKFESLMNHSSMAWPTDWFSHLVKPNDAFFHMNPVSVAGDNASLVLEGVEFMKMIVLARNFTDYRDANPTAPLLYVVLVSTEGDVYRAVMCDLVSHPMRNSSCEMRNTDQPYITVDSMAMRINNPDPANDFVKHKQKRVSSVLSHWRMVSQVDFDGDERRRTDPQSPLLKDAVFDNDTETLHLLTSARLRSLSLKKADICASYSTCVECASDPFCSWRNIGLFIGDGKCEVDMYGTEKRIQDVLGRGESCFNQSFNDKQVNSPVVLVCQSDAVVQLSCNASTLFRGPVFWRYKPHNATKWENVDFDSTDELFSLNSDNSLLIDSVEEALSENRTIFECFGVPFDNDEVTKPLQRHTVIKLPTNCTDAKENIEEFTELTIKHSYCPLFKNSLSFVSESTAEEIKNKKGVPNCDKYGP